MRILEPALIAAIRLLAGATPRWHGSEPSFRQRVYFANHASHLDFLFIHAALPPNLRRHVRPVAAADYWNKSALRRYLMNEVFHGVLLDRKAWQVNPLEPCLAALNQGDSLIIFPEGTRGSGQSLQAFKPGIAHLAKWKPDVELVPVWIDNAYRILPKGFFFPVPLLCSVSFGAPLFWRDGDTIENFLRQAHASLQALCPR
jgi:1-acyl-sn-glycerol-3-phosphate acyltransferase